MRHVLLHPNKSSSRVQANTVVDSLHLSEVINEKPVKSVYPTDNQEFHFGD